MKLLLVEDEIDLRTGLAKSLREQGYAVDCAEDGEEAVYKAANWEYDAILLDVMLPSMDGWEVLRRIRPANKTPVLILTARRALEDRVRGLDLGADDYVIKPFDLEELHARLRAIIRRSKGEAATAIRMGRITLDAAKQQVFLDGQPVDLTRREYALVEHLLFRRGEVVSRTELYEHLFSEEDESFSNLLDVHVCNIRKKIGKDFIQTRRGHGYFLAEI